MSIAAPTIADTWACVPPLDWSISDRGPTLLQGSRSHSDQAAQVWRCFVRCRRSHSDQAAQVVVVQTTAARIFTQNGFFSEGFPLFVSSVWGFSSFGGISAQDLGGSVVVFDLGRGDVVFRGAQLEDSCPRDKVLYCVLCFGAFPGSKGEWSQRAECCLHLVCVRIWVSVAPDCGREMVRSGPPFGPPDFCGFLPDFACGVGGLQHYPAVETKCFRNAGFFILP